MAQPERGPSLLVRVKLACYSDKTNHLLNYLTLDIRDPSLRNELSELRKGDLNQLLLFSLCIGTINIIVCLVLCFGFKIAPLINLVTSATYLFAVLLAYILNSRFQKLKAFTQIIPIMLFVLIAIESTLVRGEKFTRALTLPHTNTYTD